MRKFNTSIIKFQRLWRNYRTKCKRDHASSVIGKHIRGFLLRRAITFAKEVAFDLELEVFKDMITLDDLIEPCFIKKDWVNGTKVLLNISTIKNLRCIDSRPIYIYTDNGVDRVIEFETLLDEYKSPFSRRIFLKKDIFCITLRLLQFIQDLRLQQLSYIVRN